MVRPKDLPQPVREHRPHESLQDSYRAGASPGPCAYDGFGVTVFTRSHKLGFMPQAQRFRYKEEASVGPIYNPQLPSSSVAVTMKGRHDKSQTQQGPGPGEYNVSQQWEGPGVGFTQAKRNTFGRGSAAPAPGTYDPAKPKIRNPPSAFFGSSTRASGSILSSAQKDCDPQIASLAAMDTALSATRARGAQIAFPKSTRGTSTSREDSQVGPGSYDLAGAAKHIDRSVHGVVFGQAPQAGHKHNHIDPPLQGPPPLNASSQKAAAPAISFSKATYVRGLPPSTSSGNSLGNAESSGHSSFRMPLSNVSYSQIDPSSKVVAWRPSTASNSRFGSSRTSAESRVGPGAFDIKSTLGGPHITFTRGTRSAGARRDPSPGPAAYSPQLPRRPESAAQSFTKAKRQGIPISADAEAAPGPKYDPIVTPRLNVPAICFPKEKRDTRPSTASSADASYTPAYSHVDKSPHGAILYLTG